MSLEYDHAALYVGAPIVFHRTTAGPTFPDGTLCSSVKDLEARIDMRKYDAKKRTVPGVIMQRIVQVRYDCDVVKKSLSQKDLTSHITDFVASMKKFQLSIRAKDVCIYIGLHESQ